MIDIAKLKVGDRLIVRCASPEPLLVRVCELPQRMVLMVIEGPEPSKPDNYLTVYEEDIVRMATAEDIATLTNLVPE